MCVCVCVYVCVTSSTEKEAMALEERNILAAARAICVAEDMAAEKKQSCCVVEEEIASLVHSSQLLGQQLEGVREDVERQTALQQSYRARMDAHSSRVSEEEQANPLQRELEEVTKKIAALKETSINLYNYICSVGL